jgi:lincosamide nucleotidyltransferase A/C/D/E
MPMDDTTRSQIDLIAEITAATTDAGVPTWLFGGWGLDARIGRVTRAHGDIEFWVDHVDADLVQQTLVEAGMTVRDTQPPEEATEYDRDGTWFSTAYFLARPGGTFTSRGRFDDWTFPMGSFPDEPVILEGLPIRAMSVAGMLAMKEQYPRLRNGRPWRDKDVRDIEVMRAMLGEVRSST